MDMGSRTHGRRTPGESCHLSLGGFQSFGLMIGSWTWSSIETHSSVDDCLLQPIGNSRPTVDLYHTNDPFFVFRAEKGPHSGLRHLHPNATLRETL